MGKVAELALRARCRVRFEDWAYSTGFDTNPERLDTVVIRIMIIMCGIICGRRTAYFCRSVCRKSAFGYTRCHRTVPSRVPKERA
jgi:hypothetical protein